jgi:hypothetical protein
VSLGDHDDIYPSTCVASIWTLWERPYARYPSLQTSGISAQHPPSTSIPSVYTCLKLLVFSFPCCDRPFKVLLLVKFSSTYTHSVHLDCNVLWCCCALLLCSPSALYLRSQSNTEHMHNTQCHISASSQHHHLACGQLMMLHSAASQQALCSVCHCLQCVALGDHDDIYPLTCVASKWTLWERPYASDPSCQTSGISAQHPASTSIPLVYACLKLLVVSFACCCRPFKVLLLVKCSSTYILFFVCVPTLEL